MTKVVAGLAPAPNKKNNPDIVPGEAFPHQNTTVSKHFSSSHLSRPDVFLNPEQLFSDQLQVIMRLEGLT